VPLEASISEADPLSESVTYIIAVDISESLSPSQFEHLRVSLAEFISLLGQEDYAAIVTIDESVNILQSFTNDADTLISAISGIDSSGKDHRFYRGLIDILNIAAQSGTSRNVIIVISDCVDDFPPGGVIQEVRETIRRVNVPIYIAGILHDHAALDSAGSLARFSGGGLFPLDINEEGVYSALSAIHTAINSAVRIDARVPREMMDGTERVLVLNLTADGVVHQTIMETRFFWDSVTDNTNGYESGPVDVPGNEPARPSVHVSAGETGPPAEPSLTNILIIVSAAVLVLLSVLFIIIKKRGGTKRPPDITVTDAIDDEDITRIDDEATWIDDDITRFNDDTTQIDDDITPLGDEDDIT
jgi:hypothetical protein